jgi:NADH-quinone oxidoreductase subunit M
MLPLFSIETHLYFRPLALLICVFGTIYGSLAALRQIDLKRQIAFSSIAHMSFATAGIFTYTELGIKGAIYLMLSHGFVSSAMFFLIGVLSDRYHTRSVMAYSGLLSTMPMFSLFLITASLANVGFPGTSGFLPEVMVIVSIISATPVVILPVLLGMLLTAASTLIALLRLLFGHTKTFYFNSSLLDITKLEFFILSILSGLILIFGFNDLFNLTLL